MPFTCNGITFSDTVDDSIFDLLFQNSRLKHSDGVCISGFFNSAFNFLMKRRSISFLDDLNLTFLISSLMSLTFKPDLLLRVS